MMDLKTAKIAAGELGILLPTYDNPDMLQCWIDRVELAAMTGKDEHVEEANRYSGRLYFASAGATRKRR